MRYYDRNILTIQEENDRDIDYFKQFYPQSMLKLQEIIEEECDKLEYQGSMMFDEFPDKWMLRSLSNKIYDRAEEWAGTDSAEADTETMEFDPPYGGGRPPHGPGPVRPPHGGGRPPHGPGPVRPPHGGGRPPHGPEPVRPPHGGGSDLWQDIIQVLLFNEMARRRCRYRNCRF